ncbi:recombination protein O N-terminal domain-containing protein [Patescibacteria group bacterium]|nr:recombination protein O N-terminal domain-containing protein [Patescibacteria group bacterium]
MAYLRDRVIVLKREAYRERDRRYTMYGREHGLLVAVARGSCSSSSKQAGHLEPFSESEVMIAKGKYFDSLAVARLQSSPVMNWSSKSGLSCFAIAGAVSDMVIRLTRPGISDVQVFELLQEVQQTLNWFPHEPTPDRARLLLSAVTLRLLGLTGFAPPIEKNPEQTTLMPSLALISYMRSMSLAHVAKVTASVDVLHSACEFVDEAVKQTPLERELHGALTVQALMG